MALIWVLCPNLRGARLFELDASNDTVKFLRELRRPDVQLREAHFDNDEDLPEVLADSARDQLERRSAESYSAFLARELDAARKDHQFDGLVICAEPRLLDILRKKLTPKVVARVVGTIEQDLYNVNESDLVAYLRDIGAAKAAS
ncbi:MAG: host attachment protein [Oligoflexia bacterium]|nr:host attachment protein [Oligoflexia bacterium]